MFSKNGNSNFPDPVKSSILPNRLVPNYISQLRNVYAQKKISYTINSYPARNVSGTQLWRNISVYGTVIALLNENVSLFIYLHFYGPVYANVTPKLGTAHVTAFQELVVYQLENVRQLSNRDSFVL